MSDVFVSCSVVLMTLYSGGRKSHDADDDETPVRRKLPPGGRLPPLNHKPNGALRHQEDMYDDEDDLDDDDDEDEEEDTRGRPRSAAGGRKLPPLAMGDLGAKDNQQNEGQTKIK